METLDSCFDLIRSHQLCIPRSPPLEIEPAVTECRAETLRQSQQSTSHTSDAKPTSYVNCVANWERSRYTLLMRPSEVEAAVQVFLYVACKCSPNFLVVVIQFPI